MHFYHYFHILKPAIWPLVISLELLIFMVEILNWLTSPLNNHMDIFFLSVSLFLISLTILFWLNDITIEGVYTRHHTKKVAQSLRLGAILFIVSEIMLFVGFFWAFFHSFLAPSHAIGCLWPPSGIEALNPYKLPLANTMILLSSGATVTLAHHAFLKEENKKFVLFSFIMTILLGVFFTVLQLIEYNHASFSINTGIYGSVFFLLTGLHGLHICLGSMMLIYSLARFLANHFTANNHFAFQFAALYWHFVDVIWLLLFIFLYMTSSEAYLAFLPPFFKFSKIFKNKFFKLGLFFVVILFLGYWSYQVAVTSVIVIYVIRAMALWHNSDLERQHLEHLEEEARLANLAGSSNFISMEDYLSDSKINLENFFHGKIDHHTVRKLNLDLFNKLNPENQNLVIKNPIDLDHFILDLVKSEYGNYYTLSPGKRIKFLLLRPDDSYRYMLTQDGDIPIYDMSEYRARLVEINKLVKAGILTVDEADDLVIKAKKGLCLTDFYRLTNWKKMELLSDSIDKQAEREKNFKKGKF